VPFAHSNKRGENAIKAAKAQAQNGPKFGTGLCLQRVRICFEVAALYSDASAAWRNAKKKHPTSDFNEIPRGVPIFWTGGPSGHGHVAIATGDGECWSTDIRRGGYFSKVPIGEIAAKWGHKFEGWTEDINGVTVYTPPKKPVTRGPKVDAALKDLREAEAAAKPGGKRAGILRRARAFIVKNLPGRAK
jgi:hypothetical protein